MRDHYDPDVPMCASCDLDECDPCKCYRVTALIRAGKCTVTNPRIPDPDSPTFFAWIKKEYWPLKAHDAASKGYFWEYRDHSKYWQARIEKLRDHLSCYGTFQVGKDRHEVIIREIHVAKKQFIPAKYAGAIKTAECYMLKCEPVHL